MHGSPAGAPAGYNTPMTKLDGPMNDATLRALLKRGGVCEVHPDGGLVEGIALSLPFFEQRAKIRRRSGSSGDPHVVFEGELPEADGTAILTPQPPGFLGRVKARGEQLLGMAAADDAWIVRADDASWPFLIQTASLLAKLATAGATTTDTTLELRRHALHAVVPHEAAGILPALWERLVSLRLGQ